jgi:hypothetical protein
MLLCKKVMDHAHKLSRDPQEPGILQSLPTWIVSLSTAGNPAEARRELISSSTGRSQPRRFSWLNETWAAKLRPPAKNAAAAVWLLLLLLAELARLLA